MDIRIDYLTYTEQVNISNDSTDKVACIVSSVTICLCPLYPIRIGVSHFRGDISYPSRDLWDSIFLRDITSIELYSQTMQDLC